MDVFATIDAEQGDEYFEVSLSNFQEQVKLESKLLKGPVYIERQDLIQALCALEAGSETR